MIPKLKRQEIVFQARRLLSEKPTLTYADLADQLQVSPATICRLLKNGPVLKTRNSGKKPSFILTPEEAAGLRQWHLKKDSFQEAVLCFKDDAQCCRLETKRQIEALLDRAAAKKRIVTWPLSMVKQGRATKEERAAYRGANHAEKNEFTVHRGMFTIEPGSMEKIPMAPNHIWESDDMSTNEPFRFRNPTTGLWDVGRQTLFTMDVFAARWLHVTAIGRERQAYRVEDIADHIRESVANHGLPLIWRIEKSVWDNNFIWGFPVTPELRWGGLNEIIQIDDCYKSRHKGLIESSFDHLQTLGAGQSLGVGRKRGEFERATKIWLKASGKGDQAACEKFWEMQEYLQATLADMAKFNARPKNRHAFGRSAVVADDLYFAAQKRECPAADLWRFCPVKKLATVRHGKIIVGDQRYPNDFEFRVAGVRADINLEYGYRVLIAFHPGRIDEGCHVFNAEVGSRNRFNFEFGEKIMLAHQSEDAPQSTYTRADLAAIAKRKPTANVRREHGALLDNTGRTATVSVSQDSFGNRQEIARGGDNHFHRGSADDSGLTGNSRETEPMIACRGVATPAVDLPDRRQAEADIDIADLERREAAAIAQARLRGELIHSEP